MSDKRFLIVKSIDNYYALVDKERRDTEQILLLSLHKEQLNDVANLLNEQQSIIDEQKIAIDEMITDYKNLEKENEQLREINKELGDDLYNCRLNKNIISKGLKLWQNTLAEYDIYTIKDLTESFELDAKINKEKDDKIKELEVKVLNLELEKEELMRNE